MAIPSYSYRLDIRNASNGGPATGLASVELRAGVLSYSFLEVGNGIYSRASIPAGRYDLYVNGTASGQSYAVGDGELAGLGYSDGSRLGSTSTVLEWASTGVAYFDVVAGSVGATSFSISNPLANDRVSLSIYDRATGLSVPLAVVVTASSISVSGLAPLEIEGQFRIIGRL